MLSPSVRKTKSTIRSPKSCASGAKRLIAQAVEAEFADVPRRARRSRRCRTAASASFGTAMIRFARSRPASARSRWKSRKRAIAARRPAPSASAIASSILPKWARRTQEPRCAAAGALSARHFNRRLSGGADGLARQGRAQPFAGGDRAAEGRLGGRVSSAGRSAICRRGAMSISGPTASICRRAWSRKPNACW